MFDTDLSTCTGEGGSGSIGEPQKDGEDNGCENERGLRMRNYIPRPIDVSGVDLPMSLVRLAESLAENVHDTWAQARIESGWTYGPERNDVQKQNPCLVPYSELPESEKAYDRDTAIGTLKAILKLGFKIEDA